MIISSYWSDGTLNIVHEGKRYTYLGVNPYMLRKIRRLVKIGSVGKVFNSLKPFSCKE